MNKKKRTAKDKVTKHPPLEKSIKESRKHWEKMHRKHGVYGSYVIDGHENVGLTEAEILNTGKQEISYLEQALYPLHIDDMTQVLEIGCGVGRVTKHLVDSTSENAIIWATDISKTAIETAELYVNSPKVSFYEARPKKPLPSKDYKADLIVCFRVFPNMPGSAVKELISKCIERLSLNGHMVFDLSAIGYLGSDYWNSLRQDRWATIPELIPENAKIESIQLQEPVIFGFGSPRFIVKLGVRDATDIN